MFTPSGCLRRACPGEPFDGSATAPLRPPSSECRRASKRRVPENELGRPSSVQRRLRCRGGLGSQWGILLINGPRASAVVKSLDETGGNSSALLSASGNSGGCVQSNREARVLRCRKRRPHRGTKMWKCTLSRSAESTRCTAPTAPVRASLRKALGYLHRQWQRLNLFLAKVPPATTSASSIPNPAPSFPSLELVP